ncbi:hypothetical protein BB558_006585 [Smittium angustum]|uniref:Peptidase S8/S53 domain-containing protein n=1 Tax=Smittium angustum TaxID=133377 RepID=A0A2U1IXG8_SMIAN|nr:hypothetical protein BB558_006585 [Smittium angustum]
MKHFKIAALLLLAAQPVFSKNYGKRKGGKAQVYSFLTQSDKVVANTLGSSDNTKKNYTVVLNLDVNQLAADPQSVGIQPNGTAQSDQNNPLFKTEVATEFVKQHLNNVTSDALSANPSANTINADDLNINVIGNFVSYSGELSDETVQQLQDMSDVGYIQQDGTITLDDKIDPVVYNTSVFFNQTSLKSSDIQNHTTIQFRPRQTQGGIYQRYAPWSLSRLSSRADSQNIYPYGPGFHLPEGNDGAGVVVYIMDTGVSINHREFEGRASYGKNYVQEVDDDTNGHGTAVASLVAGKTFGVAKKARIISYKVSDQSGSGAVANFISALSDITNDISTATDGRIASIVVCSSTVGSINLPFNAAVEALTDFGIAYVAPAGNNKKDGCRVSPVSSKFAIVVGSTNSLDGYSPVTNYGTCVDLYAPGVSVLAASNLGPNINAVVDGTSFAAPLVAGIAAVDLSNNPNLTPQQIKQNLLDYSIKNILTSTLPNSVNALAQVPDSF